MCVPEHHEVEILPAIEQIPGIFGLSRGSQCHNCLITTSFGQVPRQAPHQPESQIGVHRVKRACGEPVPGDSVHDPPRSVQLDDAIPMADQSRPPGQVQLDGAAVKLRIQFVLPEIAAPPIVVASGHRQENTGLPHPGKGCQRWESRSLNHGSVGEPELEKITVDKEVITEIRYSLQEPMEIDPDIAGVFAQMGCALPCWVS